MALRPTWLLDRLSDIFDGVTRSSGVDDEVNMFRPTKDECPHCEVEFGTAFVDRFGQPQAGSLCVQKLEAMIATESEFMSIARHIESVTPALSFAIIHAGDRSRAPAR